MEAIFRALQKDPSCWAHDAELKSNLQDIDSLVRKTRIARLGTIENVNVLTDQSHLSDERSALSDTYVNRVDPVLTGTRIKTVLDRWRLAEIHWLHVDFSARYSVTQMEEARMLERVPAAIP